MAADHKDRDGSSSDGDNPELERFVDRDDESSQSLIDSDYADDFPGFAGEASEDDEVEDADPGYAAFADEFEDPLADWPSPTAPLDELPEGPRAGAADPTLEEPASSSGEPWPDSDSRDKQGGRAAAPAGPGDTPSQWGPGATPGETLHDELHFETDPQPGSGPDVVDSDSLPSGGTALADYDLEDLSDLAPIDASSAEGSSDNDVPAAPGEDELETVAPDAYDDDETYEYSLSPEQEDAFEDELEDEFVDDFLNDLDMPEDSPAGAGGSSSAPESGGAKAPSEAESPYRDPIDEPGAAGLAAASLAGSSVERASYDVPDAPARQTAATAVGSAASDDDEDEGRSIPLAMIAVVLVALLLLGVGGYGVVQQRSELQSEIRELQARLATTVTPEEAEAERERQRQVQLENESLNAELEALMAENAALGEQLASLEERVAEQARLTEEAEQQAAEAAARAKAAPDRQAQRAKAAAPTRPVTEPASAGGPWFVNFGSYADSAVAERWAGKLDVADGKVTVQTATAAGKTLYRVRVVGLGSQDAAERVATTLERQYQLPRLWVGKN